MVCAVLQLRFRVVVLVQALCVGIAASNAAHLLSIMVQALLHGVCVANPVSGF